MSLATYRALCIDAADERRLARFWAPALGLRAAPDPSDGVQALTGDRPEDQVWLNRVPEPRSVKNRVHLDLHGSSVREYEEWGARRLSATGELPWTVMADPEGGEFCVFVRDEPPPRRLYEVVVDAVDSAAIAGWWADVFGTRVVAEDRAFHWIDGIPGFPADAFVFVPVPERKAGKNRVHWDVTVKDVAPLLRAGASLLRAPDDQISWSILADPEGNEFCAFAPE
jgi:Glyoxalase-like domain